MARPSWVLFSLVLLGLVRAPHVGSAQTSVNDLPVYRGPIALYDLDDPLYSVRWTLGNPEPMRWLLNMPSNLALHQLLTYETDQGRVYRKYLAGEQEILPPLGFTPEEYANESFHEGLTKAWIKETGNSLKESKDRGGAPEGLINLDLPNLPFASKVFGDGAPNLRVRGSEQITVSGSSSWVVGQVTGEQGGNSLFPKLDMRQRLNVNLDGTIGSKLSVSMAQNSDALTPLENSIRIRYKGLDDEVLKTVELGNTNLSLPSTQFISYSTRQEGLFGVKTEAEVGGVSLTAIASREQGQAGQSTFNGGSAQRTIRISDWQYVEGKYFFLINPNDPNAPTGPITKIHLYLDDKDPRNNVERGALKANVWLDPRTQSGPTIDGQFHLLSDQEDYTIPNDLNFSFPRIDLTNQLSQYQTLAVAYIQTVGAVSETVGTWIDKEHPIGSDSTLVLKMLRPSDDQWGGVDLRTSPWGEVRYLEAKNVYSLQAQDIEPGSLTLDVVRDQGGSSNDDFIDNESGKRTTLLQLLGLDQKNNTDPSNRIPDQRIDPEFVNLEKGLITFPDLRPFDPDLADIEGTPARARSWPRDPSAQRPDILGWQDDGTGGVVPSSADVRSHEVVPEIYDLRHSELTNTSLQHHLFTIQAQVKAAISTTIDLGALGGVLQNSETVRLNGQELRKGDDYTIDYDTGIVTLRKPEATAPGADLVITYSQDALFQRGSHSLFGASLSTGQRDPNGKFALSSTWLHESRGVPDRRPRLNGEPTRTTVGDFSGRLRLTPWLLTDLVDKLPLVHANTPSRLELNAAMGVSFPNPNTRGEVYLDDMEGAEQTVSTGVSRVNWFYSSRPLAYRDHTFTDSTLVDLNDVDRGELLWFSPNNVDVGDVTPREDSQQARNDPVPALEVIYIPSDSAGVEKSWGGLVTSLANADVSRKQYLQVWLNDNIPIERANERRGEVLIDIGEVSEDAVWDPQTPPAPADSILNLEDLNQNGGQAEVDEDRGLDYKKNENEPARRSGTKTFSPKSPTQDPAGDDRLENPDENAPENTITQRIKKYGGINGTEGNQRLDTEDLNGDYQLERNNQYAEYRISLADSAFIDNRRDFPKGIQDLRSGWRMYRIPLTKIDLQKGGNPDLTQIRHLRMWFRGIAPGDTLDLQVASVEIVGNSWELESLRTDDPTEVLNVGVANNKENADYIEPPIEVRRIDNVKEKEQSISLNFENMQAGRDFRAFKRLQNIFDYTLYQSIGFFLNPRFQEIPTDTLEFYMRFGSDPASDTTSYYEVATRITQNDLRRNADGWIDVQFKVADLSQFKIGKSGFIPPNEYLVGPADTPTVDPTDSTRIIPPRANIDNGLLVTVRGSPSISRVGRLSVGLRNISGHSLSKGSVWYDELRMGDVRRDMGWAGTVRASMTLADFADVQGSVDLTNPDFLRLGDSRGSGTENLHYDFRGQVGLHKFMEPLHVTAPLSWRMSKQRLTPKFIPNNDILFEGDRSTGNEITEVADQGVDLSLSRDARGLGNPFLRYTVDALRLSGSYGKTSRDDVTRDDWARRLNGSASYNLGLGDIGPLRPLGLMSFWLWPRSVQLGLTGARVDTRSWTPFDSLGTTYLRPAPESITKTENLNLSTTVQPISGLTYTFATDRDLIGDHFGTNSSSVVLRDRSPLTVGGVDLGRAVQVNHNLAFAYQPPLLSRILSPRFSWSSGSNQNLQPSLTLEDYDHAVFDIANTNNATVSLTIPLSRITETSVRGPTGRVIKPNRPGHREKADTTEVSAKAQDVSLRQFFTKILKLRDIQATGGLGHRSAYSRMYGDPSIEYRLGLTRAPGDSVFNEPNAANNSAIGRNTSLRGTTSVTLLGQVDVDMSFQKSNDRTDMNSRGGLVKDTVTWPDLRFDWGDLQKKIPLIRRLSDFRIVNTSFNRTTETVGTLTNPDESTTITNRWSPLVSITGTLPGDWKTTLNASLSSTEIQSNREGGAPTVSNRNQNQYQMSLNKRFVGSGGNSKKDVDVKIDMSYSSNSSVTQGSRIQADKSAQLRMTSSATVRLTTALSGTFGLELGQESRPTSNWTRRSVRLSFTTGFNF